MSGDKNMTGMGGLGGMRTIIGRLGRVRTRTRRLRMGDD
jgi:hypothetical protein